MTDFLNEEEIYRLNDKGEPALQDKIEGSDTIILLDKPLAELSDTIVEPLNKMIEVIGKQKSAEIIDYQTGIAFRHIKHKWAPKYVLAFGISPKLLDLNISAKRNQVIQFEKERLLFAEGVELMSDADKKKMLWKNLQILFELT